MQDENTTEVAGDDAATAIASQSESDEATAPAAEATTEAAAEGDQPLGESGIAALKAERQSRRDAEKRANAAEAKLREIEQAEMTDLEKAKAEIERLTADAAKAEAAVTRRQVADEIGLPAEMVEFLTGATAEEMTEQAKRLKVAMTEAAGPKRPAADPTQGAKPSAAGQLTEADIASMSADEIEAARRDGRLNSLLGIK